MEMNLVPEYDLEYNLDNDEEFNNKLEEGEIGMTNYTEIKAEVSKLDLRQQLLELLMLDIRFYAEEVCDNPPPVTVLPKAVSDFLKEYPIGGVILFRENLKNLDEIINLTDELQKNCKTGRLIAVDQEGGTVTRIYNACEMPGNMALGALDKPEVTSKAAEILASELCALGFNFTFAPVLDVNSNPRNPIVGVRSFGSDPQLVARHGVAYCEGLNQGKMISCGKHFPGHGDTASDSHHDSPSINRSLTEFTAVELIPFQASINNGIDSIMTAHIVAPQLDMGQIYSHKKGQFLPTPATLSKTILTNLLREQLKFNGIIVSDALDMKAISDNFNSAEATVGCIEAGIDLVLMPFRIWSPAGIKNFSIYFDELVNACSKSSALTQRVFESCCRILELKARKVTPLLAAQKPFAQRKIAMRNFIYNDKHRLFQEETAAASITLAKNISGTLPWLSTKSEQILILTANSAIAEDALKALQDMGYKNITVKYYAEYDSGKFDLPSADKVLLLSYNLSGTQSVIVNQIVQDLNNLDKPYVLLSCHNPYDVLELNNVRTNVLAFGCSGIDQTNYSVRRFTLNTTQALRKIMLAQSTKEFNHHLPVQL